MGPKLAVERETTPRAVLKLKTMLDPGEASGRVDSSWPMAVFNGEKLCSEALRKCAA
jgi:hypothetical protein